ncbi:hypothetical protein [Rhodococcus pyridinivorans]
MRRGRFGRLDLRRHQWEVTLLAPDRGLHVLTGLSEPLDYQPHRRT